MILPIYKYGQPCLREQCVNVRADEMKHIRKVIENLFETNAAAHGIGLAAPQVGMNYNLFIVDMSKLDLPIKMEDIRGYEQITMAFINPVIREHSNDFIMGKERCLSFPGIEAEFKRPRTILVTYQDENLKGHAEEFSLMAARIIQHEIEHLQGKYFIDNVRSLPEKRKMYKQLEAIEKGMITPDYKLI